MLKHLYGVVVLSGVISGFGVVGISTAQETPKPVAASSVPVIAHINNFSGKVDVRATGSGQLTPASIGLPLHEGDQVNTDVGSWVELYVLDRGLVHLVESSNLRLNRSVAGKQKARILELVKGKLRGVFDKHLKDPVEFVTPTAVAAIRGTRLVVENTGAGSEVYVLEGQVKLTNNQRKRGVDLFSGDAGAAKSAGGGVDRRNTPFDQLIRLDAGYDRMNENQVPFVVSHQVWAAMMARNLGYLLPNPTYPPQSYLDLMGSQDSTDMFAIDYQQVTNKQNLLTENDEVGNPMLRAKGGTVTMFFNMPVRSDGAFNVRAKISGGHQYWTLGNFPTVVAPSTYGQKEVDIEFPHAAIKKGILSIGVSVPAGGSLVSFVPQGPALNITPADGWQKDTILTNAAMAQTIFMAKKMADQLTASPIDIKIKRETSEENPTLKQVVYKFDLKDRGLYTIKMPDGKNWLLDNSIQNDRQFGPLYLSAGAHQIAGHSETKISIEKVNDDIAKIVETLKQQGFVIGDLNQPALGADAVTNVGLLRGTVTEDNSEVLQEQLGREGTGANGRFAVSPIVPTDFKKDDKESKHE